MKQTLIDRAIKLIALLGLMLSFCIVLPSSYVKAADTAQAVKIGKIDYDAFTMLVYTKGNSVVSYSTNKNTWYEVEGHKTAENDAYIMDISWVSQTTDTTVYFKGDRVTTIVSVTLPAKDSTFKVNYNKVDEDFTFENCEEATSFQWRKATDYSWKTVSFETFSSSYRDFLATIGKLQVKGAKIIFRIPQVPGVNDSMVGSRPSKEVTVALTRRTNAPNVSVNSSKLTLNTSTSMEYYNEKMKAWMECDKTMTVEELAPLALYKNGGKNVTLMIRMAATASRTYSKTAYLTINGQKAAPTLGGSNADVSYWYQNGRLMLKFNSATSNDVYSYTIVKPGNTLDITKASFTLMKTDKAKTITQTAAPEGSIIYIRKQGTNANASRGIELELSSELISFKVSYK